MIMTTTRFGSLSICFTTHRQYAAAPSVGGRTVWLPIFDKHHLTTAFEHHDHVFKRTKLLRNNQPPQPASPNRGQ
jgi:hypothetical protein